MKSRVAPMVHRDEVHGDVRFDRLAVALLDTGAMQRLGRVYQLGFAPLVYRGGNHTRLSHVMGVYHAAGRIVDALRRNYESEGRTPDGAIGPNEFLPCPDAGKRAIDERWSILRHMVGWAALLHDVGHVPFGHTLEDEFDRIYRKHDDFLSERAERLWIDNGDGSAPEIRAVFLQEALLPEVFKSFGITGDDVWRTALLTCFHRLKRRGNDIESFAVILERARAEGMQPNGRHSSDQLSAAPVIRELEKALRTVGNRLFFPYMADIVADTICADYLDYLQRDPRNLGLDVLKDDRVVSQFWIGRHQGVGMRMALALEDKRGKPRLDTTTGVVDLVRQRYRFAEIVYYHKTKAAASVMFAAALRLLGKDRFPECPDPDRLVVEPGGAKEVLNLLKSGKLALAEFERRVRPKSLLDPEVGDEGLMLLMQQEAILQIRNAAPSQYRRSVSGDGDERALRALRALSLLQNLARRKLHKVVFALDAQTWVELYRGSGTLASDDLDRRIEDLRRDHDGRAQLEARMQNALTNGTEGKEDCLLLYVPARKSQAKGIETGALDAGDVITLGEHRTVKAQVEELGQKYRDLWRLLVFAHPGLHNPMVLSRAVDHLLAALVPGLDLAAYQGYDAVRKACWFPYVGVDLEGAGSLYRRIPSEHELGYDLSGARSTSAHSLSDAETAVRAALLDALRARKLKSNEARQWVAREFERDGSAVAALQARSRVGNLFSVAARKQADSISSGIEKLASDVVKRRGPVLLPRSIQRKRRKTV